MSLTCHKSLSEFKKRMIVLDLYFFRPPAIKRLNKEENNITINEYNLNDGKKLIRETNEDICDIENALISFCTTEMNTTIDSQLNLLEYEEVAFMSVISDENNSYQKNKVTKLIDETSKMTSFSPEKYKEVLTKLLPKLEPYFQTDILFTPEKFQEVYIASKEGVDKLNNKLKYRKNRKLTNNGKEVTNENNLFNYNSNDGIEINMGLMINSGINSENSEANSNIQIEDLKKNIATSKESSSNFNKIINELIVLSESGNHLATQLYEKTNNSLDSMTLEINERISDLNSLIKFQDFSEIFDSTLSLENLRVLPTVFIDETTNIKNKLSQLLNEIENGGIKKNISVLNNNIYEYIEYSHDLVIGLFDNLKKLSEILNSKKSKLTEISTYYLNNTSNSFIGTIEESESILNNYYKYEFDLIKKKVDLVVKNFEDNLDESLQKEEKIIESLYTKLDNRDFTIERANDEDYKTTLSNLYYIKNSFEEIKNKIKEKIIKEMEIKDSGYLMSNYDISSNNYSFYDVIEKSTNIANTLDNDEYIDEIFDKIMTIFEDNFTNILKEMDKKAEELFPLNENVLKETFLTNDNKNAIGENISNHGVTISNKIRMENDYYISEKNKYIENFLKENKQYLYDLTSDLFVLFSEESLEDLAKLYYETFESCLNKINNELHKNKLLSKEYLDNLNAVINNKTKIIELLKNYHTDDQHLIKVLNPQSWDHRCYFIYFEDTITSVSSTEGYKMKYQTYKDYLAKSQQYINNKLYKELLLEYKGIITPIREVLQNFKNNKISDVYKDLEELYFIDDHIKNVDSLFDKLNKYISDNIFNNIYVEKYQNYTKSRNSDVNEINNYLNTRNGQILRKNIVNDQINDFCVTFERKKSYLCVNGVWSVKIDSDNFCYSINDYSNNHLKLIEHTIDSDINLKKFHKKLNEFYSSINQKVNSYTEKIKEFKNTLLSIEERTINQKITLDYLSPLKNEINSLLYEKYGDEIIKSSYNYYQNNIENIMGDLLNDISDKWNEAYDTLKNEMQNNINNFKNSIDEFGITASIYRSLIEQNITRMYFDSIETHQKSEFNYTITYYYNYLLKVIKSTHQNIINKIPTNNVGFNNILDRRRTEVNDLFNYLINNIINSENEALTFDKQIYVLQVPRTNFFKINSILSQNVLNTNISLSEKINDIFQINNHKINDEISLTCRFYLQNSISGKQVEELYEEINKKVFVYLNLEKFKELLIENWIFDQDEFISKLSTTLYNNNLEISQEFLTLKEEFSQKLESQITFYFTKEEIEKRIADLYKNQVKDLDNTQVEEIKQNIVEILNKIKSHFSNEAKRLNSTLTSYNKDYSQINNRLNGYKTEIFNKLKNTVFKIIDDFHQNMFDNVYTNYVEKYLNEYIKEANVYTTQYNEDQLLLNSSYNLGVILDNIILNYVNEYKDITRLKIDFKYNEYHDKIKEKVNLDDLEKLINDEISNAYNSILYPILKEIEKDSSNNAGYDSYDLSQDILDDIDSTLNSKISKIEEISKSTKGDNYEVDLRTWDILDFSNVGQILIQIKDSFNTFFTSQKENEESKFNTIVKSLVKSNFNNLLNNIIPSFGNDFFKRVIRYNENFKISSLYNNLKYSLVKSLGYYLSVTGANSEKIHALTKDLKIKLFSLNDLDLTVQNRNNEVLNLLETKVDEFILDSKDYIIQRYKTMLETDTSIQLNFNELIYGKIEENIISVQNDIERDYISLLNKYFKEQLISSYTEVMNSKTNEMVEIIKNDREILKSRIDDLFTVEPDSVLNDINNKMNNTLVSIKNFNAHLNTFQISDNLINYLNNYGETQVQPLFEQLLSILNRETKHAILVNLDENIEKYNNNFNLNEFINKSDNIYLKFKNDYIEKELDNINTYGTTNYPLHLENEINRRNELNRRRLERLLTEEEIEIENQQRIADKAIDDTFKKLLTSSSNTKKYIDSFEKFQEFDNLITKYIDKVNSAYKSSQKRITDNAYEEDILNSLNEKLEYLKTTSLDYYTKIKESYDKVKNYLIESINNINDGLNECANITYSTFAEKYKSISDKVESVNNEVTEITEGSEENTYVVGSQNQITTVNYTIVDMTKKTKFQYNFEFEDSDIKKPKVKAIITNQNKPKKLNLDLSRNLIGCGRIVEAVEVEVNDVNYSMDIDFSTQSTDINVTLTTFFESFQYSREIYEIEENPFKQCYFVDFVNICVSIPKCNDANKKIISNKQYKTVPMKNSTDFFVVKNY